MMVNLCIKLNSFSSPYSNNPSDSNQLLKRSPVVRDVTSGFAQISSTSQLMQKRKMTILVPSSLDKTISLEALNPINHNTNSFVSNHDYENMALININRNTGLWISSLNCYRVICDFSKLLLHKWNIFEDDVFWNDLRTLSFTKF